MQKILGKLGPIGRVIESIAGIFADGRRPRRTGDNRREVLEALAQLERSGLRFDESGQLVPAESAPEPPRARQLRSGTVDEGPETLVDTRLRATSDPADPRFNADNGMSPWILTPQSSNVYAFAYDYMASLLYVVYKATERGKKLNAPGPTYSYGGAKRPFPARSFDRLRTAASKGKFIWNEIRVRGTVWGHQYPYTLVSASWSTAEFGDRYVPRKATKKGFRTRSIQQVERVGSNRQRRTRLIRSQRAERLFRN